ncbi:hypothetical protein I3843_01G152800 [Carya illinoinensis]|uniref:Uncharacterized protein n=1 Tax=Carya illinoinensis TaxID=32201 RepID=A0A8T1RQI1_CARIL|nr:uncharacterized protein LOC122274713 [Carya illinoinensis]KAG2727427.1 hypothetical protein I3760_01G157700 [Carya illinoinensis]KAG6668312.1 hypothetical protein CIPAW_01G161500 [Carya illinoinensis]KAG6732088.1 hypothetical protein I3842_01G160100 [Carya illinoinensis]KAG7996302.1 hypothetical protein I3843_01G152800 [Carya illinoinensis]
MEGAVEVEDDLFFADLNKQISLLIMDDEEDDQVANCPVSFQNYSRAIHPPERFPPILYEQTCRRESKGTGVFIPQLSQPRRKHRQGRSFASYNTISRRKPDTSRMVSQDSSNHSFKPRKG